MNLMLPFLIAVAVCSAAAASDQANKNESLHARNETDNAIAAALERVRIKHNVPALSAAIVTSRGIDGLAAVGVRKAGTTVPVTTDDLWHLGSNTKAMTASLVARMVERGLIDWNSTVASVFPDLASEFAAQARTITVMHLLTHHAGLPENLDWQRLSSNRTVREVRLEALKKALASPPAHVPGSKFLYSNVGYVVVGAMIERVTRKPWEQAIRNDLFDPLAMKRTGFGGTGTRGGIDQPWGHTSSGKPVSFNGPDMDNPPVLGPAGRVHAPMNDWARFISDQLIGARGRRALLKPSSYAVLHTPPFDDTHAAGWIVVQRDWGGGKVLNHCGCNTMNYANAWLAPSLDFAVLICVNQGDNTAFNATDEVAQALIQIYKNRSPH